MRVRRVRVIRAGTPVRSTRSSSPTHARMSGEPARLAASSRGAWQEEGRLGWARRSAAILEGSATTRPGSIFARLPRSTAGSPSAARGRPRTRRMARAHSRASEPAGHDGAQRRRPGRAGQARAAASPPNTPATSLADPFGYPLRLRTSTKLGYKNAKWIKAIEVTNTFRETFWSKQGFNWFAGI